MADVRYLEDTLTNVAASDGDGQIEQFITGTYQVFGMAADLAGFLAVYGAVFNGNLAVCDSDLRYYVPVVLVMGN